MTEENDKKQPKQFSFAPRSAENARAATTVVEDQRQRRSVRNLILAGIIATSGIIASGLILTSEEEIKVQVSAEPEEIKQSSTGLELRGLSFKGVTSEGNDFIVLAETAIEDVNNPELVELKSPRARVDTSSGNPMTLRSLDGAFNRSEETVDLKGRVVIVRPDLGYTLMTDAAIAYLDTGRMISDREVRGFSPRARVRSDGIIISEGGEDVLFTGKSTLRIETRQSR